MCLIFKILLYDSTPISSIFEHTFGNFQGILGHFSAVLKKKNVKHGI